LIFFYPFLLLSHSLVRELIWSRLSEFPPVFPFLLEVGHAVFPGFSCLPFWDFRFLLWFHQQPASLGSPTFADHPISESPIPFFNLSSPLSPFSLMGKMLSGEFDRSPASSCGQGVFAKLASCLAESFITFNHEQEDP